MKMLKFKIATGHIKRRELYGRKMDKSKWVYEKIPLWP